MRSTKLNAEQKQARKVAELAGFIRDYGRKTRKGLDANDRCYDRGVEARIRHMSAEELDRLLREDGV